MPDKIIIPNLNDFLQRYIEGESENSLSKELGINRWTFRQRLIEAGIKPRSQSKAEAIKWERMTAAQRSAQVAAAHDACRGRKVSFAEARKRAKSREGNLSYNVSTSEVKLGEWLRLMQYYVVHNFAVGPYNCDLGLPPITVEIWGGSWHPKPIDVKRTKYILDEGFAVLIIDIDQQRFPLSYITTKYIISLLDFTSGNPSNARQYWMVRGDGELIFKRVNSDNISLIPPFTSRKNPTNGQYERIPR